MLPLCSSLLSTSLGPSTAGVEQREALSKRFPSKETTGFRLWISDVIGLRYLGLGLKVVSYDESDANDLAAGTSAYVQHSRP